MDRGYVKLWRKITDSPCFKNEGLLKVWIWCLSKASHKGRVVQIQTGRGFTSIQIQPGQFVFGRKIAASELDMDESTVYKRMQKLKNISITISNYDRNRNKDSGK